jgi:hypothetical protein
LEITSIVHARTFLNMSSTKGPHQRDLSKRYQHERACWDNMESSVMLLRFLYSVCHRPTACRCTPLVTGNSNLRRSHFLLCALGFTRSYWGPGIERQHKHRFDIDAHRFPTASPNSSICLRASRVGWAGDTTRASNTHPNIFPPTIDDRANSADLAPAVG